MYMQPLHDFHRKMASLTSNILIGVTGSVASIKLPLLVQTFFSENSNIRIKIVTTNRAKHFYDPCSIISDNCRRNHGTESAPNAHSSSRSTPSGKCEEVDESSSHVNCKEDLNVEILGDDDEWARWNKMGDEVLHIELCRWADVFVIAPLDANTLGKLSNGLCDNLLTCIFRAWDIKNKPLVICPAMNTRMWDHPITGEQISRLISWGHTVVPPISKKLACGDEGTGAMAEVKTIVEVVLGVLNGKN